MKSGVYKIVHIPSGRLYIGSSIGVSHRLLVHRWNLRRCRHPNKALQNAWNKYGESNFLFQKILVCRSEDLLFYEQLIIEGYRSHVKPYGYNIRKKASSNAGMRPGSKKYKIGDKFGRLVIIGRTLDRNRYEFLCDCGKRHITLLCSVVNGNTKSCGCLHNELNGERYTKVKVGDKYNKLTLIRLYEKRPGKQNLWLCRCDCGTERTFNVNSVRQGATKSCGCAWKDAATRLRGILVSLNGKQVSCAEAERIMGIKTGYIHYRHKYYKITHQQACDYFAAKKQDSQPTQS